MLPTDHRLCLQFFSWTEFLYYPFWLTTPYGCRFCTKVESLSSTDNLVNHQIPKFYTSRIRNLVAFWVLKVSNLRVWPQTDSSTGWIHRRLQPFRIILTFYVSSYAALIVLYVGSIIKLGERGVKANSQKQQLWNRSLTDHLEITNFLTTTIETSRIWGWLYRTPLQAKLIETFMKGPWANLMLTLILTHGTVFTQLDLQVRMAAKSTDLWPPVFIGVRGESIVC